MKKEARVIALFDNQTAELAVRRDTACGDCATCGGCDAGTVHVTVENVLNASVGDTVFVETATGTVVLVAALVYLLPLILFFTGYALGDVIGVQPLLVGGIGFATALVFSLLSNRKLSGRLQYHMVGIVDQK